MDRFSKNTQTPNFIKFRPVGGEVFRVDRPTDRPTDKLKDRWTGGRRDRHDEGNNNSLQFRENAKRGKNIVFGDYAINSILLNPMSLRIVSKKNT